MGLFSVSKTDLSDETIAKLEIVDKLELNLEQEPVKDIEANDTLEEIKDVLKTIKEQNDEIIGDEF